MLYVAVDCSFSIVLTHTIDWHVGNFQFEDVTNSATMNITDMSSRCSFLRICISRQGISDTYIPLY